MNTSQDSDESLGAFRELARAYGLYAAALYTASGATVSRREARRQLAEAKSRFLSPDIDHVTAIRRAHEERLLSTVDATVIEDLPRDELQQLLPELVAISCVIRLAALGRRLILSLPRDWVVARIESAAKPIIDSGDGDDYRRLLELYSMLDPDLTRRLAELAAASSDPEVREPGIEFLATLGEQRGTQ